MSVQKIMLWLVVMVFTSSVVQAESLVVEYFEYPPYYHQLPDGQPAGLIVDLARKIFVGAGVDVRFSFVPAKRILHDMHANKPVASLGWFKTPEREEFAQFSLPIYVNRPVGVLVSRAREAEFRPFESLQALMDSRRFFIGRIGGLSDGPFLDALLATHQDRAVEVTADSVRLLKMLKAGRFDFVLIPPEEMDDLLREAGMAASDFMLLSMRDIPDGNTRYIMYSKAVAPGLVRKIDEVIRAEIGYLRPGS